jgi:hypothetical protein
MHKKEMDERTTERKLLVRLWQMCWDRAGTIGFELLKSWRFVGCNTAEWVYICRCWGGRVSISPRNMNKEVNGS